MKDSAPAIKPAKSSQPRRRFSADYKLAIVREADRCTKNGELNGLLQREGLYSSHLAMWRKARERGELVNPPKRGRKPKVRNPDAKLLADLQRQLDEANARAERAEALVEARRKIAFGIG